MYYTKTNRPHLYLTFILLIILLVILGVRLFFIQVISHDRLFRVASQQHNLVIKLEPKRGAILDRNERPLAVCTNLDSLYANPREIKDRRAVAHTLSTVLPIKEDFILNRLSRDKAFVWIARKLSPQVSLRIRSLNIKGLGFLKEPKRLFPDGTLASHLMGFVGIDNEGLEGVELYYNKYLCGIPGSLYSQRDAKGRGISFFENKFIPPVNGYNLLLTIDEIIQHIAEKELDKAYTKYHAKGASIVVIDPKTGQILALASRPTYDLNNFRNFDAAHRRNRAVADFFEPGSSFKIVTASGVLEENVVSLNDKFFCENGSFTIGKRTLHDHRPHGWLTFREVIEQSSNIGTVKSAMKLGPDKLYKYMKSFGFGELTHVDLPGEVRGIVRPVDRWSKVSITSIPMGQEVTVTNLQLASAISVIANGGTLMKPMIVKAIIDDQSEVIKSFETTGLHRVISQNTANKMKEILSGVVNNGTGKLAQMKAYTSAGKTGTAQKVNPGGTYSHTNFTASFIGFAPVEDPKVAISVILDDPHPMYYGGVVCAPVFKEVAEQTLKYLGVPVREKANLSIVKDNANFKGFD